MESLAVTVTKDGWVYSDGRLYKWSDLRLLGIGLLHDPIGDYADRGMRADVVSRCLTLSVYAAPAPVVEWPLNERIAYQRQLAENPDADIALVFNGVENRI